MYAKLEQQAMMTDESSPLVNNGETTSKDDGDDDDRRHNNATKWILAAAIVVGLSIGTTVMVKGIHNRRQQQQHRHHQEIHVAEGGTVEQQQQEVVQQPPPPWYRPICEYYGWKNDNNKATATPRILQTSMSEASKPWSMTSCVMAQDANYVELNDYGAPDAILQVNFSNSSSSSSFKPILGFGGAFTEAAALNFYRLPQAGQDAVLELLFGRTGLGYAVGRVPINSVDFSVESYSFDNTNGDFELQQFDDTVQHDVDSGMIGMAQSAVQKYQESWSTTTTNDADTTSNTLFRMFASPWSPPAWMKRPTWEDEKANSTLHHASKMTYSAFPNCLRDGVGPDSRYARAWATYFSKFITAYRHHHGIELWGVTVQNEPEFAAPWEACTYSASNMTDFVAYHLGPVLQRDHPNVTILAFDHNKDHVNAWMMTMLNGTNITSTGKDISDSSSSSSIAAQYIGGTAYHWYAGGMDRLLDGAIGNANLHRLQENLKLLGQSDNHVLLGSEACHCPTTGYAGGDINVYWDRAERYAHTILADLAAGSQGWLEWNLILDAIGGPNHVGNLCESALLSVPHRAADAAAPNRPPLPDFEHHSPMGDRIKGDERTREELNTLGFPAKYLDLGIAVQPIYYYMGHISRHVRPGSLAVPALVRQNLGSGEIFRPVGASVVGGGENNLARNGIELTLWPCEGSTRQQFRWNTDFSKHISVHGHDWLDNETKSCIGRSVDKDLLGMKLTDCKSKTAGMFDAIPLDGDDKGRYNVRLLNHPKKEDKLCLVVLELKNGGGAYGPLGGAQVALGDCDGESAKWKLDLETGSASSTYFANENGENEVCMTTGWPFLQMGAFLTPTGDSAKTVVILNEARDAANYALKDGDSVVVTGSIPPRSIQTLLLD